MAEDKYKVYVESETDEASNERTGKKMAKGIEKGMGIKNGYIELSAKITGYKYPKQTTTKSGLVKGTNYTELQKAQDKLISDWNKLAEKGFYSSDKKVLNMLKSYKGYKTAVQRQYGGDHRKELEDDQLNKIRSTIGAQIERYFVKTLGKVPIGEGKEGRFTATGGEIYEKYALEAIKKVKAAKIAGIDLSKDAKLTEEERKRIDEIQMKTEEKERAKKSVAQRKYEIEHAKEIKKEQTKQLQQIEKERQKNAEKAIPMPEEIHTEDVELTATKVENLGAPTGYKQTAEDIAEDKDFIKGVKNKSRSRKSNTPINDVNLDYRSQMWDPTFLTDKLLSAMERGGTYVGSNALLRQTAEALPEEIKKSIKSLSTRINKDEASKAFTTFDKSDQSEFQKLASDLNISKQLLVNVARVQGGLMAGREDSSPEALKNAIVVAVADAIKNGKSQIAAENYNTAIKSITNMLMNRYSNMKDAIGSTIGRRKKKKGSKEYYEEDERGVGINYKEVEKTLKEVFEKFEEASQALMKRAVKEFPDFYNEGTTNKKGSGEAEFDKIFTEKLNNVQTILNNKLGRESELLTSLLGLTKINNVEESVSNTEQSKTLGESVKAEENLIKVEETDANDGYNKDSNARASIKEQQDISKMLSELISLDDKELKDVASSLKSISQILKFLEKNDKQSNKTTSKSEYNRQPDTRLVPVGELRDLTEATYGSYDLAEYKNKMKNKEVSTPNVIILPEKLGDTFGYKLQNIIAKSFAKSHEIQNTLKDIFPTKTKTKNDISSMLESDIQKMITERREKFGQSDSTSSTSIGDKTKISRRKLLWGKKGENPFADLQLTKNIDNAEVDNITKALQKSIEKVMFSAQTGGIKNNLLLAGTMGLAAPFIPSLEKSRAEAEAANQMMANIRDIFQEMLQFILDKKMALQGFEAEGKVKFGPKGNIIKDISDNGIATTTFAQMEDMKLSLRTALADMGEFNEELDDAGGNLDQVFSKFQFLSNELRGQNKIIKNIRSGLDKNGKALKFQTRAGEIINYTFQRIARHIGQMLKNWLMMLNPINLIKKAFQDFASYDVKWQRTMNVIKYNIRRIIRPFMEWLAQQIVNVIGLINAVVKGIGKVFGYDWDLFDRVAADAEKTREELEAAANVSAGFDELHDIGGESSSNAAMDLLNGDIYTPQWDSLYQGLEEFGKKIAEVFKGISDFFANADFWDWLAIGGAALLGFFALRWLIDWFSKGTNPLQSVADGFKSLEKSVGWALLIWAVSTLVDSLREFVDVVGQMETKQVAQALFVLAVALITVGAAIVGIIAAITLVIDGTLGTAALGILAIAAVIAAMGLVISSIALLMLAINELMKTIVELVKIIFENADKVVLFIQTIGVVITTIINTIGDNIVKIIESVANAIVTIWTPILTFIDKLIDKFLLLASIIAHEVGETIRSIVKTVGATIIAVIHEILNAIPNLLNAILRFCREIGPAIENSVDAVMRSITKLINFVISAVEYMINTLLIGGINGFLGKLPGVGGMIQLNSVQIARFVPQYEQGTNFVPNDGLAYLHQGEAVVPKKYNQLNNNGLTQEEKVYMAQMITVMRSLDNQMKQGINVNGQFVQRGSDLVAVVNKTKSQTGADLLSNVSYAR